MTRTIPGHVDSTGKLLERIALCARGPVLQKGKVLRTPPSRIVVAPSLLREFRCVAGCTACCLPFTLDYTNDEYDSFGLDGWTEEIAVQTLDEFEPRQLEVNGKNFEIQTYPQYKDPSCPYLRPTRTTDSGEVALGCGFWSADNSTQPLECAAAPQLLMTTRGEGTTVIMKRPFGRGWAWKDKPQCEFDPVFDKIDKIPDDFDLSNEVMLLERYCHWANYLEIDTYLPEIIAVVENLPDELRRSGLTSVVVVDNR